MSIGFVSFLTLFLLTVQQAFSFGAVRHDMDLARSVYKEPQAVLEQTYAGEPSDYRWSENDSFDIDDCFFIEKKADKDFTILNIADIHYSDFDVRALMGFGAESTVRHLVRDAQPDLITVSGDMVCGDSTYYSAYRLTELLDSFGIPWAPFFGNHDGEANCDLNYIADVMMSSEYCLFKKGDPSMGVGNYVVNIGTVAADGSREIVESLVILDSHGSQPYPIQQKWFKWVTDGINAATDGKAEITMMCHIPLPEYRYAQDRYFISNLKGWQPEAKGYGEIYEEICCERDADGNPVQRGFFDVLKNAGTVKYVFCGHEHLNDFSVEYEGVRLTYMLKVGQGSGSRARFNGGTLIKIDGEGISSITQRTETVGVLNDIYTVDCAAAR